MIVLVAPPALSLILISSPRMKVPDVSLNVIVVLLPPALFAKPVAPLANPSTNEVSGNCAFVTALLTVIFVYFCMLKRYKSN